MIIYTGNKIKSGEYDEIKPIRGRMNRIPCSHCNRYPDSDVGIGGIVIGVSHNMYLVKFQAGSRPTSAWDGDIFEELDGGWYMNTCKEIFDLQSRCIMSEGERVWN